jgi:hypothetical protein
MPPLAVGKTAGQGEAHSILVVRKNLKSNIMGKLYGSNNCPPDYLISPGLKALLLRK